MAKPKGQREQMDFLTERAIRFFNIYGDEVESISQILKIRLGGLASAYTVENKLPREAVAVHARVKSLTSFLRKLEKTGRPWLCETYCKSRQKRKNQMSGKTSTA